MLVVYVIGADGRRIGEQGDRRAVLAYLASTTARRVQIEFQGERSPVADPPAAERYVALFCR